MQVVHARCGGLDVHQRTVTACVLVTGEHGAVAKRVRTFAPMTEERLTRGDGLASLDVTHAARDATGV